MPDGDPVLESPSEPSNRSRHWLAIRLALWTLLTFGLAVGARPRLASRIPGDIGDAYLVLALLDWGGDRSLDLFAGFWQGPFFAGADNAMAYSDTFLPLVVPFKLFEAVTGSSTVAFNLLYLASWVVCAEATYALALRLLRSRPAAVVVAATFTFSTLRLSQVNHFQLTWTGLVPLALLMLFRLWDRPTVWRGVALAAVVLAQLLTSAYHGVILIVIVGAAVAMSLVKPIRRREWAAAAPYAAALTALAVPLLYIRHQYEVASRQVEDRASYPAPFALRPGDLRAPSPNTRWLDSVGVLDDWSASRAPENYAYVGSFVVVGIIALIVVVAVRTRAGSLDGRPSGAWVTVCAAGLLGLLIAVGRGPIAGIDLPFYDIARHTIPGVGDMVAIVRLFLFTHLALALLAGAALVHVLNLVPSRPARVGLAGLLLAIVAFEGAMHHPMTTVIEPPDRSVHAHLASQDDGVVLFLPIVPPEAGIIRPFVEAPRMVLGLDDEVRSVNGYSGYTPVGYADQAGKLNEFPSPVALAEARRLKVRFVVIYTSPLPIDDPGLAAAVNESGWAFWGDEQVSRVLDTVPPDLVADRFDGSDGIVLELRSGGSASELVPPG